MNGKSVLDGYARDASGLIERFEMLDPAEVLMPVLDLLPLAPSQVLDVGAGTGRDAAWLAGRGYSVCAVEPVAALRDAGRQRHGEGIKWIDDCLPALEHVRALHRRFDLVLLVGVWQHLDAGQQQGSMEMLANLVAPRGRLIVSVRHGPGAPCRPCFEADPDRIDSWAAKSGLRLVRWQSAPSIQAENKAAGVTWTWMAWERS